MSVELKFKEHGVVDDSITVAPKSRLEVLYNADQVDLGNELTPFQVQAEPKLWWTSSPNCLYTLVFIDLDAPSRADPTAREVLHWLVGNISGHELKTGVVLADFIGSGPPKGSGLHRYVYLLYQQAGVIQFHETPVRGYTPEGRRNFSVDQFAKKYALGDPVAGNFYLAQYDHYVEELYRKIGLK